MALIQVSFQDNANNEASFRIYRGTNSAVTTSDTYIAEISLAGSTWSISGQSGTSHALTSSNTGDATTTGETFTMHYTESTPGTYYYGVCAHNSVGSSNVATSGSSVVVSG